MKRFLIITLLALVGCAGKESIADKAVRLVRTNYPNCEKIIAVEVDTITLGDNLDYRIRQRQRGVEYSQSQVDYYKGTIKEFNRYGASARKIVDGYKDDLRQAEADLEREKRFLAALDSLKQATLDIAGTPTAYEICVTYNYYSNRVWVQLDADGTFLKMSESISDLLLNPGEDMPGYIEIAVNNMF